MGRTERDRTQAASRPPRGIAIHTLATAGHVDHGKSTLVLALTGMDPDRFAEEKTRGLTIDLGFAWTTLPSGRELAFVDVPGHVRFIKNMLAGVGAVDACVFVVAATEGWKPQSEEHLRILELLGVTHGVIALTKVGLVDDEWLGIVRLEVTERVAGTFLEGAPILDVDPIAGVGVEVMRDALDSLLARTAERADRGRPRLWVDRVFAARGAGTVVTGTLTGGALVVDDEVIVIPGTHSARVRGLQTHKASLDTATPGRRLAINITGVSHTALQRGHAVVRPHQWEPTKAIDCSLRVLASLDHEVSARGAFHAYIGSGEYTVRLRVLVDTGIAPGDTGLVRLHLPTAIPLLPGDRYILRESGRHETVGGGEVLDIAPVLPARRARPDRDPDRVVRERGWVDVGLLERLTGDHYEPTIGRWVVAVDALAAAVHAIRTAITNADTLGLDVATLNERQRAVLATITDVVVVDGRARFAGADDPLMAHPYLAALAATPFAPPTPEEAGVERGEVRALVRRGVVVERDGLFFAPSAIDAATDVVRRLLADAPEGVTASAVREALGTSRKYALPILSELDGRGLTRRRGDVRVAGPRLVSETE